MMRIGLMSDTHGNTNAIDQAVEMAGKIDLWLHAGDVIMDAEYLRMVYDAKVINVAGNCDGFSPAAEDEELINTGCGKIFLTHGHLYSVKYNPIDFAAACKKEGASIGVFGHSHVALAQKLNGVLLINPGSLSYPRDGKGQSFMVLELAAGREPEIYHYHLQKQKKK